MNIINARGRMESPRFNYLGKRSLRKHSNHNILYICRYTVMWSVKPLYENSCTGNQFYIEIDTRVAGGLGDHALC